MKYSDINFDNRFVGNMRDTPWSSLFPRWFMEDDFIKSIGKEIEYIKSKALFKLLNIGVKPPVLLWQESLVHKKYVIEKTIKTFENHELDNKIKTKAPLYKTWGTIKIINHGEELNNLKIFFNEEHGISINEFIDTNDTIFIDIENQKFYLNDNEIDVIKYGDGMPYFITSRNHETYKEGTPLHNEALFITFFSDDNPTKIELKTETILNNVVFENEQNIDITSLELLPLEKVVLYAEYDFPYNKQYNGVKKVYEKKYDVDTNVVSDMITTQFFTKNFYVEVYFKDVEHPYVVGFPCYKDADLDSMYHVNTELDSLGEILELQRRNYKTNILEKEYPFTFPEYYPFDIEQDYWYYQRLVNEYAWNDNAIDRVDVKDTEDNTVMRLHSINPFIEDFVVYANSTYPKDVEGVNYNEYLPSFIYQDVDDNRNVQTPFQDTHHLLRKDDNFAYNTLYNKSDNNITYEGYKSKEMGLYFDLSNIPDNVNIDGFEIIIDTESTDNLVEKYNDNRTRLQIANNKELSGFLKESGHYELKRKNIIYGDKKDLFGLEVIPQTNNYVEQKILVGSFTAKSQERFKIPFEYYEDYDLDKDPETNNIIDKFDELDSDDVIVDGLQDVMIFFYNIDGECVGTTKATYHIATKDDIKQRYLLAENYPLEPVSSMNIVSTQGNKHAFNIELPVESRINRDNTITSDVRSKYFHPKGYEGDLAYLLRNYGLYFIYALTNDSTTNSSSILIHNILLRVYYSPKKEKLLLETSFERKKEKDDNDYTLGKLHVYVENIGEKSYQSDVDIICPDNLILSKYHCDVDLEVGASFEETIDVSYNISVDRAMIDGQYNIVIICDDLESVETVKVKTLGENYTTTSTESKMCFIDRDTELIAQVTNIDNEPTNEGSVEFRLNGYRIGEGYVVNGEAAITMRPINYEFIRTGANDLEVIYSGSQKYNMSRGYAVLWINKNKTKIILDMPDVLVQRYESIATISVVYIDENGDEIPMPEGNVSLFLGDEEMFTATLNNGEISVPFQPSHNTGIVTAKAIYGGTDTYPSAETTKEVNIIGGDAKLITPDINARPDQKVTLTTYVYDMHDNEMPYGFVDFTIKQEDEIIYEYKNAPVYGGKAQHQYRIPANAISLFDEDDETEYEMICSYHSEIDGDIETDSYSHIYIAREEVKLIYHFTNFAYSNKEPLGFYVEVLNKETGYPVSNGVVTISIPNLGITIQEKVDEEGKLRTIYSPLEFSSIQWDELFHTEFTFKDNELYNSVRDALKARYKNSNLYFENDLYPEDGKPQKIDFRLDSNNHLLFVNTETEEFEHIYAKDTADGRHVFIKTSDDAKRYFDEGNHNIFITYVSDYEYKKQNIESRIHINNSDINVDIPQLHLTYSDINNQIVAYVTQYKEQLHDSEELINNGMVNYYVDGTLVYCGDVQNSLAIMPSNTISRIPSGKHLLMGEYFYEDKRTYTYTYVDVEKVPSVINPNKYSPQYFNRVFPGKKSKISFKIDANVNFSITGHVNVYLNDTQVGYTYLNGEENGEGIIELEIPTNLSTANYTYQIIYSGDDRIAGCSTPKMPLQAIPLPIKIEGDLGPIKATPGTECNLFFKVNTVDPEENDDITEGKIAIFPYENGIDSYRSGKISNVINNVANINFKVPNEIGEYNYYLRYVEGNNYVQNEEFLTFVVNVIEGYDPVIVDGTDNENHVLNLKTGLWAVKDNGKIFISSWEITKSGLLENDFLITKDVTITGDIIPAENSSDEDYAQNVMPYIESNAEELINVSTKIHSREDFTDDEFRQLHLLNIDKSQINVNEFRLIDHELYYIQDSNNLMPIYLFDDGLYYARQKITPKNTILKINKHNVIFENIRFKNADWYNKFVIQNNGQLTIKHCIIEDGVQIDSTTNLICNENLIYGKINASNTYNIDNNWWGKNTSPLQTNNNIIIKMETEKYPPVVGELIDIRLQMIGENGEHYNLPQAPFKIYAETGNISIESGYFVNSQVVTSYNDAIKEGKVFAEVDNEKTFVDIYEYDRKTEVILKCPKEAPIGYQIGLKAIVQSVADKFYKFDENNNVIKQSNNINNGYVTFYINNNKIGKTTVKEGKAELPFYISSNTISYYEIENQDNFEIKAVYNPEEYYFSSEAKANINFINENNEDNNVHIKYISPNASSNGDGSYGAPFQNIQEALSNVQNQHTYRLYLKEGLYQDINIDVTNYTLELIRFDEEVVFTGLDNTIITINEGINGGKLILKGIDFVDNTADYLIRNNSNLEIEDCIFYNNNIIISNNFENYDNRHGTTIIKKSAIVNNNNIATDYTNNFTTEKCWFGVNDPSQLGFKSITPTGWYNYIPNNYILMDLKASKDIIYIGSIAHIIASLDKQYDSGIIKDYKESLPLRIALFSTTFGSLMPLKDFTHNKVAISLLNTTETVNSNKFVITAKDNTNYYGSPLKLQVFIENTTSQDPINNSKIKFEILQKNKTVIPIQEIDIINGTAIFESEIYELQVGEYNLKCIYEIDNQLYQNIFNFKVELPKLLIENIHIDDGDHLYNLIFDADIKSTIGDVVDNVPVKCYIDNRNIGQYKIQENHLLLNLQYSPRLAGQHTLRIETTNFSKYQQFIHEYSFNSYEKATYIDFQDIGVPHGETKQLEAYIYDDNHKIISEGYITVTIDNQPLLDENDNIAQFRLINGKATFKNPPLEDGRHSIIITYSGVPQKYQGAIKVYNNFNVGIYPVKIVNLESDTFKIELGDILSLNLLLHDNFDKPVTKGNLYFDVDDICLNQNEPVQIKNGKVTYDLDTRRINIGTHDFTIRYIDESHIYANTNFTYRLIITQIETKISISTITATPDTQILIDYNISSKHNIATSGVLRAFLNDIEIGTETVTNNTRKPMKLSIPYYPTGDYSVIFKYHDNESGFADAETQVPLIIKRGDVKISAPCAAYYPKEEFNFDIDIKDIENKPIGEGNLDIYIDNVLKYQDIPVIFGKANILLTLNQVKKYKVSIKYKQNDYYKETLYDHEIDTNKISIINMGIVETLESSAGVEQIYHLTFDTIGDHNVEDGIVDFVFDGNTISSQYIQSNNKEFKLNIPIIYQGVHKLQLKYYNSDIFNNFISDAFDFIITPEDITLTLDNVIAELNNTVVLNAKLSETTTGVIKFYIAPKIINENNEELEYNDDTKLDYEANKQLIGIEQVANRTTIPCQYQIPTTYNENHFIIKAEFRENSKYKDQDAIASLIINEMNASIALNNVRNDKNETYIQYQDLIIISGTTNIVGSEVIDLYIDDENIGQTLIKDGIIDFEYRLNKKYKAGQYTIKAKYQGSKVIKSAVAYTQLDINKYTPKLKTDEYSTYIGADLELNNIVLGNRDIAITEGTLIKKINGEIIPNTIINKPTIITPKLIEGFDINVEFNPLIDDGHENNEYNSFTKTVPVEMKKNPVTIRVYTVAPTTRGETVSIHISMTCDTTPLPIDLIAIINNEEVEITNGQGVYNYTLPMTNGVNNKFILPISIKENDIFIEKEHTTTEFEVPYINRSKIYITSFGDDNNTGAEDSPVATIQQGLNLVANNGIIYLQTNVSEDIVIDKSISIDGYTDDTNSIIEGNILINEKCNLSNLIFNNSVIDSNAETNIDNCEFNNSPIIFNDKFNINQSKLHDSQTSAIVIKNKNKEGNIQNCEFYNNNSDNGASIYAQKGDNLIIEYSTFNNNTSSGHGASLYLNGDSLFRYNSFYENNGLEDVYVIAGGIESEFNIFDNNITNIANYAGYVNANMTYWGMNDINEIDSTYITSENGVIAVESWLESDYHVNPEPPLLQGTTYEINTFINKYRANRDDQENITIMEPITWKGDYPIYFDNIEKSNINSTLSITPAQAGPHTLKIGKEEFIINE